jgi:hypothetical protein
MGNGLADALSLFTYYDRPRMKNRGLFGVNYVHLRIDRPGKSV